MVGRRQVGVSRARAKQVPVVGCPYLNLNKAGPIEIFFMVWNSLHTCNRVKAAGMLTLLVNRAIQTLSCYCKSCRSYPRIEAQPVAGTPSSAVGCLDERVFSRTLLAAREPSGHVVQSPGTKLLDAAASIHRQSAPVRTLTCLAKPSLPTTAHADCQRQLVLDFRAINRDPFHSSSAVNRSTCAAVSPSTAPNWIRFSLQVLGQASFHASSATKQVNQFRFDFYLEVRGNAAPSLNCGARNSVDMAGRGSRLTRLGCTLRGSSWVTSVVRRYKTKTSYAVSLLTVIIRLLDSSRQSIGGNSEDYDGLTKEQCIAAHLFWAACRRLGKRSGWLFLALYLKQSRVCLQRFVARDSIPVDLSPAVSLTRSGLPRIIPSFHRRKIREGNHLVIQLYMSFFTVSRLIPLAKKVDKSLFDSIVTPAPLESVKEVISEMKPYFKDLLTRYIPGLNTIPLNQGLVFEPTWKSVPSWAWYRDLLRKSGDEKEASSFLKVVSGRPTHFIHSTRRNQQTRIVNASLEWFEARIGPYLPTTSQMKIPSNTGRLCAACTGDGKRRLFAVGNYINQRLLAPFHDWLATCLRRIPMDGTYDQLSPLDRLEGSTGVICSVDLKAATDRWPLLLLFELTQVLFGRSFASSAVNSALATNIFQVAFVKKRTLVSFIAGQPLGYRSSWPLFALSHHLVVWVAAEQEYPGKVFKKYAVLGDDVVIADPKVASRYETLVHRLGVKVSAAKSIRSPVGACEFAKRFRVDNLTVDLSPVSMRKAADVKSPIGWYNYVISMPKSVRLSTLLRIGGFGFKAASRPIGCPTHGKRGRRLLVMLLMFYTKCFSLETSLSIVLGRPIPPQCVGALVHALLEHFAPKELKVPPIEVFAYPGMAEFNEYSVMQGWMRQYLSYLKWYSLLYTRPVSLGDFFEAPVYTDTWFSKSIDPDVFRFGVAFRVVDMATRACNKPSLLLPVVEEPPIVDSFVMSD
ncbi:hypothetical protein HN51_058904 [Arachis hypogaea]